MISAGRVVYRRGRRRAATTLAKLASALDQPSLWPLASATSWNPVWDSTISVPPFVADLRQPRTVEILVEIERDRGVKDFGQALSGQGGVLDRIDWLCFAGPICFHLTRYFTRYFFTP